MAIISGSLPGSERFKTRQRGQLLTPRSISLLLMVSLSAFALLLPVTLIEVAQLTSSRLFAERRDAGQADAAPAAAGGPIQQELVSGASNNNLAPQGQRGPPAFDDWQVQSPGSAQVAPVEPAAVGQSTDERPAARADPSALDTRPPPLSEIGAMTSSPAKLPLAAQLKPAPPPPAAVKAAQGIPPPSAVSSKPAGPLVANSPSKQNPGHDKASNANGGDKKHKEKDR